MRDIGVIIPRLDRHGGAERFAIECIARWQQVCAITVYATQFDVGLLGKHGIDTERVRLVSLTPLFTGPQGPLLNGALLPKIWEQEIGAHDLYHAHQWPTHLIDRHPLVWFPHEPRRSLYDLRDWQPAADPTLEAIRRALRLIDRLGHPDRIVANSRYTARYLEDVYGRHVTDVVYPGVNPGDAVNVPVEPNVLATVGYLGRHKRLDLLLQAAARVPGVQLHVAGSGPQREELEQQARMLGIAERVFFVGSVSNHDIQMLLARSLAVLFAPVREPFGIVALEALAAGRPLIAVAEGGYTEVIDDSCAFLVPPEPQAIAERIAYLRDRPDVADRMGRAGRVRAGAFTWDRTAAELLAILRETHHAWHRDAERRPRRSMNAPAP
jgi:glycosyltransferase involved in cell wall biosynthesis